MTNDKPKQRRGFAAMDPATRSAISSMGGKAAHEKGAAHEWSTEEARVAGRKGGLAIHGDRSGAMGPMPMKAARGGKA